MKFAGNSTWERPSGKARPIDSTVKILKDKLAARGTRGFIGL